MSESIRVVVADDSPFVCRLLRHYLESDKDIEVIGTVHNGKDAIDSVKTLRPDVLTLDLNMPVVDGLEALQHIMTQCPTSVVLISGVSKAAARMTEQGLALGAVDFIFKYSSDNPVPPEALKREIIAKVKAAARVKVIRSIPSMDIRFKSSRLPAMGISKATKPVARSSKTLDYIPKLVVIGSSTGGPLALKDLLRHFHANFPFSVVIVQHMPEKFTAILADQFNQIFPFSVKEAADGTRLKTGTVIVAPGDRHLIINSDGSVHITQTREINGHRPSIDVAMQSAAQAFGDRTVGVILSGMGNDGAQGMLAIQNNCGLTFTQSSETCVIDSMPKSAMQKVVVDGVGAPATIGQWLMALPNKPWKHRESSKVGKPISENKSG